MAAPAETPTETPRPNLLVRGAAAISVVLLTASWGFLFVFLVTALSLAFGAVVVKESVGSTLTERDVLAVASVTGGFLAFVGGAFAISLVLTTMTTSPRSVPRWTGVAWLLAAPATVFFSAIYGNGRGGGELGVMLWLVVATGLLAVWVTFGIAGVAWRAGQRSTGWAGAFTAAAILFVVIPQGIDTALPAIEQGFNEARHSLSENASVATAAGATDALARLSNFGEAAGDAPTGPETCFEQLNGEECGQIWSRAANALGRDDAATHDAMQRAYVYVCITKAYTPKRLCGAFWLKAKNLKSDAWKYERRFREYPSGDALPCAVPSAEEDALSQEELNLLDDALARLDPRSRDIIHRSYTRGQTDAEIALALGLSPKHVARERRAALARLKEILQQCQ